MRRYQYQQALEFVQLLSGPAANDSITVAELRPRAHDILLRNHDRESKSIICYPVNLMADVNILIIRVATARNYSTRAIKSVGNSKQRAHYASTNEDRYPQRGWDNQVVR